MKVLKLGDREGEHSQKTVFIVRDPLLNYSWSMERFLLTSWKDYNLK